MSKIYVPGFGKNNNALVCPHCGSNIVEKERHTEQYKCFICGRFINNNNLSQNKNMNYTHKQRYY